jgi:hypothetical protein
VDGSDIVDVNIIGGVVYRNTAGRFPIERVSFLFTGVGVGPSEQPASLVELIDDLGTWFK